MHRHRSTPHPQDESYIVLEGRLTVQAGEQRFNLAAGAAAVVPLGSPHLQVDSDVRGARAQHPARARATEVVETPPSQRSRRPCRPATLSDPSPVELEAIFRAHGQVNTGPSARSRRLAAAAKRSSPARDRDL